MDLFMKVIVRKISVAETYDAYNIIEDGRRSLQKEGCSQWQDGNPNLSKIKQYISRGQLYGVFADGILCFVGAVICGEIESSYKHLYSGEWQIYTSEYITIHALAAKEGYTGMGLHNYFFDFVITEARICKNHTVKSIRIDTHPANERMKHILEKIGFVYCGIVYLDYLKTDRKRNVYELVI